jgi:hypothetical protein
MEIGQWEKGDEKGDAAEKLHFSFCNFGEVGIVRINVPGLPPFPKGDGKYAILAYRGAGKISPRGL